MRYISTRNRSLSVTAAKAIASGLAPDGGLFAPESIPALPDNWMDAMRPMDYAARAAYVMSLYLDDFPTLADMTKAAYSSGQFTSGHPATLRHASDGSHYLELFHGPTCAFKDMALQALPRLLPYALKASGETRKACILVSTSGDTGKAALEGFRDVEGICAYVFYPRDGVSPAQKLQMVTQEGQNVGVCAVEGNFDDAQTAMKAVFTDPAMQAELDRKGYVFSSANSINWGRLVPQIAYYASAYLDMVSDGYVTAGKPVDFCVPTGNFGNILAGWYAMQMGVPIGRLLCASNANHILTDFLLSGFYLTDREFYATLSPSMDILVSSNLERALFHLSGGDDALIGSLMKSLRETGRFQIPDSLKNEFQTVFTGDFCDDAQTKTVIRETWEQSGVLLDPHTAVAKYVTDRHKGDNPVVIVATASPYKFSDAVSEALGLSEPTMEALCAHTGVAIPAPLTGLADRSVRFTDCVAKDGLGKAVLEFLDTM